MTAARDTPVGVRLLGPVQAWRDDDELDLGTAHRRAVFAVLAMRANHAVPREELIAAVWGESAPASAAGSVYTYVSALRGALEPDRDKWSSAQVLTSAGGGYCLRLPEDDVDALRFDALRETTRRLRTGGDSATELATLREALSLWHGEAFAGIPGPYAQLQRLRLAELRLTTLERHATLLLGSGDHDEVITQLGDLVDEHPMRETMHGLLMTALVRRGRAAEALDVYRRAHRTLIEQSGTEPSAALRRLHDQILAGELGPDSHTGPPVPAQRSPQRTPRPPEEPRAAVFVGRDVELTRLRRAVTAVGAGQGGCVWIEGEPGIGKTALLVEGLRGTGQRGSRLGWGVGDELAQRVPLGVLLECLDLDAYPRDSPGPDTLTLVEALTSATAGPGAGGDPTAAVLDRLQKLVREVCARTPLVLVIDDLQWADEASLLAWHSLHRLTSKLPLLLVAACRPAPRSRRMTLLRGVLSDAGAEVLTLPPLTPAETAALVLALDADPELAAPAGALAAGNPLYLTSILSAATRGEVRWADSTTALPPVLTAPVTAHLDLLPPDTRQVLRAAAFLGTACTVSEIAAVTGRTVPTLIGAMQEALSAGVLVEIDGERLAFRHPLVRRVLHDGTPAALRLMLHREFAEKLAVATGSVTRVAEQLLAGPFPLDAWAHHWLAGNVNTLNTRAPQLATALLGHARGGPPAPRRPPLQARRIGVSAAAGPPMPQTQRTFLLSDGT